MAKAYRPVNRDQPFLLPPDMREWLPEGHAVWLVVEAVRLLDTSVFHARRRLGGRGAPGFDPDMLLTVLVWAYANGVTSSRRVERLCQQDVAFRVAAGGNLPDHVSIARFRQQFAQTAAPFFAQVLLLCARLGMGQVGTVALDGTKVAADASKDANRTGEGLRKLAEDLAARHAAADADEDARFGEGKRGDDDPGSPGTRGQRVAAALASLEEERAAREAAGREAGEAHLEAVRAGHPPAGRRPAGADVAAAQARVDRETAAYQEKCRARAADAAAGRSRGGPPPVPAEQYFRVRRARADLERARERAAARAERAERDRAAKRVPKRNVTDPDSRLMPLRGGGFAQGYNAQNVTSEDGLVLATRLTNSTTDTQFYQPMTAAAADAAAAMAAAAPEGPAAAGIGQILADAGYLSEANLAAPGPDRLIATGKHRDLGHDPGRDAAGWPAGPLTAAMAARLAAEDGAAAYRRRSHIGETFHGDLKHNQQFRRLSVRGLPRACGEWTFAAAVRNLRKAITSGCLTPQALTALAG